MSLLLQGKKELLFLAFYFFCFNSFALQLGDGTKINQLLPICVMNDVESVYTTDVYSVILRTDSSVWATGFYANPFPYIEKDNISSNSFTRIHNSVKHIFPNLKLLLEDDILLSSSSKTMYFSDCVFTEIANNVLYFYEKNYLSAFISKDKSLWAYGAELKDIKVSKYDTDYIYYPFSENPKRIDGNVIDVISKDNILIYLKEDGSVWGMGTNVNGRLIETSEILISKPIKIAESISKIFINDYVYLISNNCDLIKIENGKKILIDKNVKEINDFFYIKNNGELYAFGFSSYGALGIGETKGNVDVPKYVMNNVKKAKGTEFHSLILTNDNRLYSCGGGWCNFGSIGDGTNKKRNKPVMIMEDVKDFDISNYHSMVIKNDNSLWAFGLNNIDEYELYE